MYSGNRGRGNEERWGYRYKEGGLESERDRQRKRESLREREREGGSPSVLFKCRL